jgi:hypothetical protein
MLLSSRFASPLPAGAGVASSIKEWTATVQLAVVQYYDVDIADAHAVEHFRGDLIKPVPNHDFCSQCGQLTSTGINGNVTTRSGHLARRWI